MPSAGGDGEDLYRRWAGTELACYTVDGWAGTRRWGMTSGLSSPSGESILMAASLLLTAADGSTLEIGSNRPIDEHFLRLRLMTATNMISQSLRSPFTATTPGQRAAVDQEVGRLHEAARDDRLPWEAVLIAVDGRPTIFAVTRTGAAWAAVGRAPEVDLTLVGLRRSVPSALVRLDEAPPQHEFRPPLPPRVRAHRFPDEELAPVVAADVEERARVDLVLQGGAELTGTVGGTPVQLRARMRQHGSPAQGHFGAEIQAEWRLGHNEATHPDVPGSLTGTYGGQPVTLRAVFHLDDDYVIDYATIEGDIGGQPITGRLDNADGGLGHTGATVYVEGAFAGTDFSLFATIAAGYKALVRGQVAGRPLRLDAKGVTGRSVRVVGCYEGPAALLTVIVMTVLEFV